MTSESVQQTLDFVPNLNPHKSSELPSELLVLLDAIERYIADNARPPAWDDISRSTGISRSTLRDRTLRLVRSGHLANSPGSHRSLAITTVGKRAVRLHRLSQQN